MRSIFISGISSGIGKGLANYYCHNGIEVYGTSRRIPGYSYVNLHHTPIDLTDYASLPSKLDDLLRENAELDMAILNAGILGTMSSMKDVKLDEMKAVMETNLWSQKVLMDELLRRFPKLKTVIGISSGAAVNGSLGWSGYSLSKAAFNMLLKLYASEYPDTKFIAFAPGLVDTAMQDYLWTVSEEEFPNLKRIHDARGTENMPKPDSFAPRFDRALKHLGKYPSGSFIDIRQMKELSN